MPAVGGIRFGQYVLQRRIARGGMAEVFLAQQRGLEGFDRRVAVKRILPHLASAADFIQMFLDEARLAAQLSHPNLVHIYDFGKVDSDYFIAMEYVDGVHAGQVFRRAEPERPSPAMVARIGADAAAALHYAHELRAPGGQPYGLVHRDVSPANLMVSFDGVVKLCDFGIAKAVALGDRQLTSPGLVKGKYAYMSPEQTVGAPLDGRSDVYALAIVLWELLAGQVLVPRGDPIAAMRAIRNGTLTPIRQAAPWTPAPLADAITWALETRREHRATAAQLAQALEAFIKSSPEIATAMQLGSWLRARFPREPFEPFEPFEPAAEGRSPRRSPGALEGPSEFDLGSLSSPGSFSADTTSETVTLDPTGASGSTVMAAPVAERREPRATGFESTDPPAELPIFPGAGPAPGPSGEITAQPGDSLGESAPTGPRAPRTGFGAVAGAAAAFPGHAPGPAAEPEPRPSAIALEHGETLMRSGAYRPLVPSGPAAVPTLLEPRPVAAMTAMATVHESRPAAAMATVHESRPAAALAAGHDSRPVSALPPLLESRPVVQQRMSPVLGVPAMPGQPPRIPAMTPAARATVLVVGMCGLAVLSFAIVLGVRRSRGDSTGHAAVLAPRPAPAAPGAAPPAIDAAAPATSAIAAIATPGPPDAADAADAADAPVPPDAAAIAQLDVHTDPAGATAAIYRCPDPELARCRTRPADTAKLDGCGGAPCTFHLPAGNYVVAVELDGSTERRTVALMADVSTSLDIVFKSTGRAGRSAPGGKLTVHTRQRCDVVVDGRRRLQTPVSELELRAGGHRLELTCGRRTFTRSVTITQGATTELSIAPR